MLSFSLFPKMTVTAGREHRCEWEEFATRYLCHHRPRAQKDGELYSPAIYATGRIIRRDENVIALSAAVIDFDNSVGKGNDAHCSDDPSLPEHHTDNLAGVTYAVHSTYTHRPDWPRWRMVIPFDRRVTPAEWPLVFAAVLDLLGHDPNIDQTCRDLSRAYWAPSHPPDMAKHAFAKYFPGEPLCVDTLLSYSNVIPLGTPGPTPIPTPTSYSGRNDHLKAQLAACLAKGKTLDQAIQELIEYDQQKHQPPLFTDPAENGGRRDAYTNALRFVASNAASINSRRVEAGKAPEGAGDTGWEAPAGITADEWKSARPTPDCIVENYLFADVGVLVAPGGTGKTTLILYEAIHIVLGWPLYGLKVLKPGPVVILTAEDSRPELVARLRLISTSLNLTPPQIQTVMQNVRIADVCGTGFRLTEVVSDVVRPSRVVAAVSDSLQSLEPSMVVVDPAVSFGVGESRVNDAEQGLVEAARQLRRTLNCCVRYSHHTGKSNAREKTQDQYTGRGGSAFADGSRMVHVMHSYTPAEWLKEVGQELAQGATGLTIARAKMTHCPPQEPILLSRTGYDFQVVQAQARSAEDELERDAAKIWLVLKRELAAGRYHSQRTIEVLDIGIGRNRIRAVVSWMLEVGNMLQVMRRPDAGAHGARTYLHPVPGGAPAAHRE